MATHSLDIFAVAEQQIDVAIDLFYSGDWICSCTLAFAAEGVLQKYLEERAIDTSFKKIRESSSKEFSVSEKEIGRFIKRLRDMCIHGTIPDTGLEFSDEDIIGILFRAISDYVTVTRKVNKKMDRFAKVEAPKYRGYNSIAIPCPSCIKRAQHGGGTHSWK